MKRFLTLLILYILIALPVSTQEIIDTTKKTALGVNPAIMEVIVDKESVNKEVSLYNLTNFPLPIKTLVESFTPKEKSEIPKNQVERYDASSWIKIPEKDTDFILQPREVRNIKLTIEPPDKASPGGHYASIVFQPLIPQQIISRESIFIFTRVAVLTFIQVKGEVTENLEFKALKINSLYQTLPDSLELVLKNTGNTHLRPNGRLVFYDETRKKTIGNVGFLPSIILPGTEKSYLVELTDNIKLTLGRYSVWTETSYGADNILLKSSKHYFTVFPYTSIALAVIIFIIIIAVIIKLKSRLNKAYKILVYGERFEREEKRRHFRALEKIKIKRFSLHKK